MTKKLQQKINGDDTKTETEKHNHTTCGGFFILLASLSWLFFWLRFADTPKLWLVVFFLFLAG
jgi:UDP-N-acetylmuramyl pentapeptide phosphotransferase/UDP-N-acetylglucosamine-1-phosphate transferase